MRDELTNLEIRNLMLETLAYDNGDIDLEGHTFPMYNYQGREEDLYRLMEGLAIKKHLIDDNVKRTRSAWSAEGKMLLGGVTTNFNNNEIKKIYESFYLLLNRGVIAPGGVRNYGSSLPYFHVTDYGKKCIRDTEILPYDSDGYLDKLDNIDELDEWVKFYIQQGLECFNVNCYEASLIMIGLANERLVEILLKNYEKYLANFNDELTKYKIGIGRKNKISKRYLNYQKSLERQKDKDIDLNKLSTSLDKLAMDTFSSYVRLTRNELSHPSGIITDRITALMIFISFINYCERQYKFINYFGKYYNNLK